MPCSHSIYKVMYNCAMETDNYASHIKRTSMHTHIILSLSILSPSPHVSFSLSFSLDVHVMYSVHKKVHLRKHAYA